MNYIKLLRGFENWCETNYLPGTAELLWYKLVGLFNRSGWKEWIEVDTLRLMSLLRISDKKTLIKNREHLIQAGLLDYQKGKKGVPGKYRLLCEKFLMERTVNMQNEEKKEEFSEEISQKRQQDAEKGGEFPQKTPQKGQQDAEKGGEFPQKTPQKGQQDTEKGGKFPQKKPQNFEKGGEKGVIWCGKYPPITPPIYKHKQNNINTNNIFNRFPQREYDFEEYERLLLRR